MRDYGAVDEAHARLMAEGLAPVAAMATTAALLRDTFPEFFWVGFYLPASDGGLTVGPYQGPLACHRLPPGRGVCGQALRERRTVIVDDVHAHPDHISCDARSRSEIVVPVAQPQRVLAVLDIDAVQPAAFGGGDAAALTQFCARLAALEGWDA